MTVLSSALTKQNASSHEREILLLTLPIAAEYFQIYSRIGCQLTADES